MSDGLHLLVPFAACSGEGCRQALRGLALPQLDKLLARLVPAQHDAGDLHSLSMPHERVLAREAGLPATDGLIPLAAWQVRQAGGDPAGAGWAWITPCHWQVGADHVFMHPPQALQLEAGDAQALLAAMQPYFEQDGLTLAGGVPTRWLASGPLFAQLPLASLDRVAGRVIDPWIPRSEAARPLRRLQQEMQMLLYTHPVNEARIGRGLLPINSFWASGSGVLPATAPAALPPGLQIIDALRDAALPQDWPAWAAAWQQLDAHDAMRLLQALDAGRDVALTLCGEAGARTWRSAGRGWRQRIAALWPRQRAADALLSL